MQSRYGVRLDDLLVNEAGWHQIKEDNLYRRKFIENMVDAAEMDDLLVNEAGWHQIKEDNLYRRKFIENMVDAAETEWK